MNEDKAYEEIWNEIESNSQVKSIWARAVSDSDGNSERCKSIYIKLRIANLHEQHLEFIKEKQEKEYHDIFKSTQDKYIKNPEYRKGINDYDHARMTPLILAVNEGNYNKVKALLELGADPELEYLGISIKELAEKNRHDDILQLLNKS